MKKLLLVFIFAVAGCSADSEDCNCAKARFSTLQSSGYFYVRNLPIDCETGQPTKEIANKDAIFIDCLD